jgi:hypothetical protein
MQRYDTTKRLGSYTITTQLVNKLTEFLAYSIPAMLSSDLSVLAAEDKTAITIIYPDHAIKYARSREYHNDTFAGKTQGLEIELAHAIKFQDCLKAIVVRISFHTDSDNNYLYMALQDENAEKELPTIEKKLLALLEQYKNNHSRIYRSEWFGPSIFVIGGFFGSLTFLTHTQPLRALFAILFGVCIYLFAFRYIKGYSTFESPRQKRLDIFFNWFVAAIAGFVVAIIILTS